MGQAVSLNRAGFRRVSHLSQLSHLFLQGWKENGAHFQPSRIDQAAAFRIGTTFQSLPSSQAFRNSHQVSRAARRSVK